FTVAAGIGVDAHLFYELNPLVKGHLGMLSYYAKATHLWLTHDLQYFSLEFETGSSGQSRQEHVSQLLAVRITQFGGVLRELAPGASLERNDMRLVLFKTRSRLCYLAYILRGLLGTRWRIPRIKLADAQWLKCTALSSQEYSRIFVEADGELLGTLPATISVVPNGLTLLMPRDGRAPHLTA